MKLCPITKDEIDKAGVYKGHALDLYYQWLNAQRKQDKKEMDILYKKIYHFKNKEKRAEQKREWARKNPDKIKEIIKRHRLKYKDRYREYQR